MPLKILKLTFIMLKRHLIFYSLLLIALFNVYPQQRQSPDKNTVVLKWNAPFSMQLAENLSRQYLNFEGAIYPDSTDMPYFFGIYETNTNNLLPVAEISDEKFAEVPESDKNIIKNFENYLTENIKIHSEISYRNKKQYVTLSFLPFRKNPVTGKTERLLSFRYHINYKMPKTSELPLKARPYASNSVLSSGNWYMFKVYKTGLHIITFSDLEELGLNPYNLDPRNIRIYGNGGQMLPEDNSKFRFDDLQENAIMVNGESDGIFNQNDYIVFYAKGPESWSHDSANNIFNHSINKYSKTSAYFITISLGPGKRITGMPSLSAPADFTATTFNDYAFYENDSLNLIKSGREFYGEVFDMTTSRSFSFNFPNITAGNPIFIKTSTLARSVNIPTNFKIYANGTKILDYNISAVSSSYTSNYANVDTNSTTFSATSPLTIQINYLKNGNSNAVGWLDYIELNADRHLTFTSGQMAFRNQQSIGKGVTEFIISNASAAVTVWDVTDFTEPKKINTTVNGSEISFRVQTDSLKEFVAFSGTSLYPISKQGRVDNQNLHGLGQYDMVIVSHPAFVSEAGRIANMHSENDNLTAVVVTPQAIYNEFSSGNQDITAIKDFVKMLYDRAGSNTELQPKFLLLMGDASYDYLNRVSDNTNYVPTYQTSNSLDPTSSFLTDDYFGFLDDTESGAYNNQLDISIGRIPVKSADEAKAVTDKILSYTAKYNLSNGGSSCSDFSNSISNFADWRNIVCFVADDADVPGENFMGQSENIAVFVDTVYNNINIDKIYMDAYTQVSTPGGQRYPDVTDAINKRVAKGALIINYIGHGGEIGWAHEAILGLTDINSWSNKNNLPFFVTATCEFSRFDDPARTSAGEFVLLNSGGGSIGLFTTTRLAFAGSNYSLNFNFFNNIFKKTSGIYPYIGDVIKSSKNAMGCSSPISNFSLLGDPALRLSYPKYNIVTTEINNHPVAGLSDTVKAMEKVSISGYVADNSGVKLTNYNGILYPSIFDKKTQLVSNGNDAGYPQSFSLQKNIIYKGKVSVNNGDFKFSFVVPKDIAYNFGKGRVSYYSQNNTDDANGYYENFIIGGTSNQEITDIDGPEIKIYFNDTKFVPGGITNKNPLLLAYLSDSAGLNTIGNGIGHDISAVLDDNTENTISLNDYYESDLDTYQSGIVKYPFTGLDEGTHKLLLKAWDIYNNSAEAEIDFIVAETADLALDHVLNYPNPFTTYTEFWFEHNQPCCGLEVLVQIFTVSGKLIKTINTTVATNGFRAEPIPWDGRDDFGDPIGKGVYIYNLKVKNNNGQLAQKMEKLVILK